MTAALLDRPATKSCPLAWCNLHSVDDNGEVFHCSRPYVQACDDMVSDGVIVDVCRNDDPAGNCEAGTVVCINWSKHGTFPVDEHIALTPQAAREFGQAVRETAATRERLKPTVVAAQHDPRQTIGVQRTPECMARPRVGPYVEIVFETGTGSIRPVVLNLNRATATRFGNGIIRACNEATR